MGTNCPSLTVSSPGGAAAIRAHGWREADFELEVETLDPNTAEVEACLGKAGVRCLATEAVEALLRICFDGLGMRRVTAGCFADNVPSWRIFAEIVVPMSLPGLVATFLITLSFIWNEFLFALFLTTSR